jgi:hypothetical protein
MPVWSMDNWRYVRRELVKDPGGREWSVALMDVLGQEGDPEMPTQLLERQYESGRYFTLIYSSTGSLQWERGYADLPQATTAYDRLLLAVTDGRVDPSQPVYREDLED